MKRALQRSERAAVAMNAVFAKELGAISHDASIPFEAIMETPAAAKIVNDHLVEAAGIEAERIAATAVRLACTLLDAAERLTYRIDLSAQGLFNLLFSLPVTFGEASDTSCVPKGVRDLVAAWLFPKVGNRAGGRAAHVYAEVHFARLNEAFVLRARELPGEWYRCQVLASLPAAVGWAILAADSRLCRHPHAELLMQRLVLMSRVEGDRTNHWRAEVLAHVTTMLGAAGCAQWMRNEGSVLLDAAQYDRQVRRLAVARVRRVLTFPRVDVKKHAHMGCAEVGARGFCCPPQLRERGPYLGTIGDWEPNARNPTQVARVLLHLCLYRPRMRLEAAWAGSVRHQVRARAGH